MDIDLKRLSLDDGIDIFNMIKEIGPGENGFGNGGYDMDIRDFPQYLQKHDNISNSINLNPLYVPETRYWLFINNKPVDIVKMRHYLNDKLRLKGGHIGYTIRPSERGKGYGTILLSEALIKAKERGINEVLITCDESNIASRKVIEANNEQLEDINEGTCRYWIKNIIY